MDAYVVRDGSANLEMVPVPTPAADECLVRVLIAGVCGTDLEILEGYKKGFSGVLGHEFVGVCETAPAEYEQLVGKRVVGDINLACSDCSSCVVCAGGGDRARNHCPSRTVLGILKKDGTYARYLTLPARNLHIVPDGVRTENAAFAEPLAAAFRIVEQDVIGPSDRVAIVGDGRLGLMISECIGRHMTEKAQRPVLFGRHAEKMKLLSAAANVNAALATEALPSRAASFDVVVDATGNPNGLIFARQLCRPLGTLVLKSTCAGDTTLNTAPFVIDELRVIGSRCGPFEPALGLLASGLDLTPLIEATFPLEEVAAAVAKAGTKGTMKVQLRCSSD